MKYYKFSMFFLLYISKSLYAQVPVITADIEVDYFGNIYANTKISNFNKKKDTLITTGNCLIHTNQANIIGGIKLNQKSYVQYKAKTNKLSYVIQPSRSKKNNSYIKSKHCYFYSKNYLAYKKSDVLKQKKFNININLPTTYQLIYPLKSDLEKTYRYSPPIIAGNFNSEKIKGFDVYYLKTNSDKNIDSIIDVLDDVFSFYSKEYPKEKSKPKVIFVPFKNKNLLGKTLEDVILLNSIMLTSNYKVPKRLLAHEAAHLWWGAGGLTFKNRLVTEGIAEFMAIEYLKSKKENLYLKTFINQKHYHCDGITDKNEINKGAHTKLPILYSYDFIPLILEQFQFKDSSFYNKLATFYKTNTTKPFVTITDFELFLKENKMKKFIDTFNLPDYYVTHSKDSVYINGIIEQTTEVNISFIDSINSKKEMIFEFSKEKQTYALSKINIKKITIDPELRTLQFSRLNDIWLQNDSSFFTKNRYFKLNETNDTVVKYATDVINYLLDTTTETYLNTICDINLKFKTQLELAKEIINVTDHNIRPTGGSIYYQKNKNEINVKLVYYSETDETSKIIYFKLYLIADLSHVVNINLISPAKPHYLPKN